MCRSYNHKRFERSLESKTEGRRKFLPERNSVSVRYVQTAFVYDIVEELFTN